MKFFTFNEAWVHRYVPISIAINHPGLRFYLAVGLPFIKYSRDPQRDSYEKVWHYSPIKLFRIIIK